MRHILFFILLFVGCPNSWSATQHSNVIQRLENSLEHKADYVKAKETRIADIRQQLADVSNTLGIGTETIKMDDHYGTSTGGDGLLYEAVVDLEGVRVGLDKHRLETAFSDREDTSDIGIGWHDDLIAGGHHPHLDIGTENKCQSIESVSTADTVARADVVGVMLFELSRGLTPEIPAAMQYLIGSMFVWRINGLQVQIFTNRIHTNRNIHYVRQNPASGRSAKS